MTMGNDELSEEQVSKTSNTIEQVSIPNSINTGIGGFYDYAFENDFFYEEEIIPKLKSQEDIDSDVAEMFKLDPLNGDSNGW